MNLTNVIQGDGDVVADQIRFLLEQQPHPFVQKWEALLAKVRHHADNYQPDYSQMAVVKCFENSNPLEPVHYANSTAIRLANIYAKHPVYCNRGVNGIEGSLSTAAGFSLVSDENVFCVIGDLSFFYDQNALWNQNLRGNLRILLMNNGKGTGKECCTRSVCCRTAQDFSRRNLYAEPCGLSESPKHGGDAAGHRMAHAYGE